MKCPKETVPRIAGELNAGRLSMEESHDYSRLAIRGTLTVSPPRPGRNDLIPMRDQENKNSGRPLLERRCLPEPLHQELFNMAVSDTELIRSKQLTNILKVLGDGGPGEGAFYKTPLPPEYSLFLPSPSPAQPLRLRRGTNRQTGLMHVAWTSRAKLSMPTKPSSASFRSWL